MRVLVPRILGGGIVPKRRACMPGGLNWPRNLFVNYSLPARLNLARSSGCAGCGGQALGYYWLMNLLFVRGLCPASLQRYFSLLLLLGVACSASSDDLGSDDVTASVLAFEAAGIMRLVDIQPNGTKVLLDVADGDRQRLIEVDLETQASRRLAETDVPSEGAFTETGLWFYEGAEIVIENDGGQVRYERPEERGFQTVVIAARGDWIVLGSSVVPGLFRYRPEDGLTTLLADGRLQVSDERQNLMWVSSPAQAWVYDAATDQVVDAPAFDGPPLSGEGTYFAGIDADGWFLWTPDGQKALLSEPGRVINSNPRVVCGLSEAMAWGALVGANSENYAFDRDAGPPLVEAFALGTGCFYISDEGQPSFRLDVETGMVERLSGPSVSVRTRPSFRRVPLSRGDEGLWVNSTLYLPEGEWPLAFEALPPSAVDVISVEEPRVVLDPDSGTGIWYEPIKRVAYRIDLASGTASSVSLEGTAVWRYTSPNGRFVFQCSAEELAAMPLSVSDQCLPGSVPQVVDTINGAQRPIAGAPVAVEAFVATDGWISNIYAVSIDIARVEPDDPEGPLTSRLWARRLR